MTRIEDYYQTMLKAGSLIADEQQQQAVLHLQKLQDQLYQKWCFNRFSLTDILPNFFQKAHKGVYLYGGVGTGKTCLMDMFYQTLQCDRKYRVHYHVFMEHVHHQLAELANHKNPVERLAKQLAKQNRVLCLDEFHVNNITDAMIMRKLLAALYHRKMIIVYTSNRPPQQLYYNGLQREQFLPAIALIEKNVVKVPLDSGKDYRSRNMLQHGVFKIGLGEQADIFMERWFNRLCNHLPFNLEPIDVSGRKWSIYGECGQTLWLDFDECCVKYRSRQDYLQLTKSYNTILISNIKKMDDESNDQARRFVNLIDAMYDQNVKLIATFEVPIEQLYQGDFLSFVFARTTSRLHEMQSKEYWRRQHRILA